MIIYTEDAMFSGIECNLYVYDVIKICADLQSIYVTMCCMRVYAGVCGCEQRRA